MSFEHKADYIVEQAKALAPVVKTWADFSVKVFGQKDGLVAKTFREAAERQLFYDSPQYKAISDMRTKLIKKFGVEKGGMPEKSGRVLVRLPQAVHTALVAEAEQEGVSLNQLAVSKLTLPLRERIDLCLPAIAEAYSRVHDGYSTDRVVVDPDLNAMFLAECRRLGLKDSDYKINHALLDIRKSKKVPLPEATKRTEFRDYDLYRFASEIGVRLLQRAKGVTLDQVLCDPALACEFDQIARQLSSEKSALKLRCAALNLRKTRRLKPEDKAEAKVKVIDPQSINLITAGPIGLLKVGDLPESPGVYTFYDRTRPVFAADTEDLQLRLRQHFAGQMPRWLGLEEDFECILKFSPVKKAMDRAVWRQWFVDQQRPLLNYQRSA